MDNLSNDQAEARAEKELKEKQKKEKMVFNYSPSAV